MIKKLIAFLAVAPAYHALACPTLTGQYVCNINDPAQGEYVLEMNIQQNLENGVQMYYLLSKIEDQVGEIAIAADGVTRKSENQLENGLIETIMDSATCKENSLELLTKGEIGLPGTAPVFSYDAETILTPQADGNLLADSKFSTSTGESNSLQTVCEKTN